MSPSVINAQAAPVAPHALDGWAALRYAVNVALPVRLARAQRVRVHTLKVLGRG